MLLVVSVVFGLRNGINVVTNQAAMYAHGPRTWQFGGVCYGRY
jgi:hypothetical protein